MVETSDIYYGAFLLVNGLELLEVVSRFEEKRGMVIFFKFNDRKHTSERLDAEYQGSQATVNIRQYLSGLFSLRDMMYKIKTNLN